MPVRAVSTRMSLGDEGFQGVVKHRSKKQRSNH